MGGVKEARCGQSGWLVLSRRWSSFVLVLALVSAGWSGVSAQEPLPSLSESMTAWSKKLLYAENLSAEQSRQLKNLLNENRQQEQLLREQSDEISNLKTESKERQKAYQELSNENQILRESSERSERQSRERQLYYETQIADLEARLRRSQIGGWLKGLVGLGGGFAAGRATQ